MFQHARQKTDTDLEFDFCDPHSSWQHGANKNTNGRLRQCFPKSTDVSGHNTNGHDAVALALNTWPRKTFGWKAPAKAFDEFLRFAQMAVATTG